MPTLLLALIILALGGLFTFAVIKKYAKNPKLGLIVFGCVFLTLIVLSLGLKSNSEELGRQAFRAELTKLDLSNTQLLINGEPSDLNIEEAVDKLRSVRNYSAHNSFPKTEFDVLLSDEDTEVKFSLSRDSDNLIEYWIHVNDKSIGKIRTSFFKSLK